MKINISPDDMMNGQIELSRSLVSDALLNSQESIKAKKLFMAYKIIEQVLRNLGIDPQNLKKEK